MESKDRTLYCGNLSDKVTEDLLYELFLQAGPLENVIIPKDKDGRRRNFGFITFKHAVSVPYAIALMSNVSLYGKNLTLNSRNGSTNEENPYLQKLMNYRDSFVRRMNVNDRGHMYSREKFEDRSRRYPEVEFYAQQQYPGSSGYYGSHIPYVSNEQLNLVHNSFNSFNHTQRISYPTRYDWSWSGNRR